MIFLLLWFVAGLLNLCRGLANNLALSPPMGWSSWGRFRCNINCKKYPDECISEALFREMADEMVREGYLDVGYEYVLMDDCWLAEKRDSCGRLRADPRRFPNGIKNLSDYIHSRGLKFGIYEDYGTKTCEGYPGIQPHTMVMDAEVFSYWNVDYVKVDGCHSELTDMPKGFEKFGRSLNKTGRSMIYACSYPSYQVSAGIPTNYTEVADVCNTWRNYEDVEDSWRSVKKIMTFYGDHQEEFAMFAGPGRWNDPDMLIIGNFGLSYEQAKVQMAIWAILAAPLIMSHDLRSVKYEFKSILLNQLIIGINQDPLGLQGKRIYMNLRKKYEVWTRPISPTVGGMFSWAIAIVNLDDMGEPKSIKFPLKYTKLRGVLPCYIFVDLFNVNNEVEISTKEELITRIPPLGVNFYKAILKVDEDLNSV